MVTLTRTQTGTINALKYDNISLQIKGEHVDLPEHISKKLKLRGRLRGKTSSVKDRAIRKSREKKVVRQSNSTIDKSLTNPRMLSNSSGGTVDSNFFWPKVVFGEEPRKGLRY